jgi:hypothetical protein
MRRRRTRFRSDQFPHRTTEIFLNEIKKRKLILKKC